jgi:hypothetical protein
MIGNLHGLGCDRSEECMIAVRAHLNGQDRRAPASRDVAMNAPDPPLGRTAWDYRVTPAVPPARRVRLLALLGLTTVLVVPADTLPGMITIGATAVLAPAVWWCRRTIRHAANHLDVVLRDELGPRQPPPR